MQLDITAPQIFFIENFTDSNSSMAVIDFGRLQLRNKEEKNFTSLPQETNAKESEEDGKNTYNSNFCCNGNLSITLRAYVFIYLYV